MNVKKGRFIAQASDRLKKDKRGYMNSSDFSDFVSICGWMFAVIVVMFIYFIHGYSKIHRSNTVDQHELPASNREEVNYLSERTAQKTALPSAHKTDEI